MSTRLSREILRRLQLAHPRSHIIERDFDTDPLPHVDDEYVADLSLLEGDPLARQNNGSLARSEQLIRELEMADYVVIGTPMHNFTLPSALKAWVDHVVRVRRTFTYGAEGKVGLLNDRPIFVAVASGGFFYGDGAVQPDFLTPYLSAILATVGLHDIRFFPLEGMVFGPEMIDSAWNGAMAALDAHLPADLPARSASQ